MDDESHGKAARCVLRAAVDGELVGASRSVGNGDGGFAMASGEDSDANEQGEESESGRQSAFARAWSEEDEHTRRKERDKK